MYPASHSYFTSIDKSTVVLKRFFWKYSQRTLFNTLRHLQVVITLFTLSEQVQNIEKSKASTVEVLSCVATVKARIQERQSDMYIKPRRTVARKFSIGGLYVCSGELDILKFDKNSTHLQRFIFQFGGAWSFVWWAKPSKAFRGDGTEAKFNQH